MKRSFWLLLPVAVGAVLISAELRAHTSPSLMKTAMHRQEVPITSELATVNVTGVVTGKFPATSALSFEYNVLDPLNTATGQASGKRQHEPITITKHIDSSSPLFLTALVTNEVLKTVVFNFTRTNAESGKTTYYTVTLTNAIVQNFHQSTLTTEKEATTDKFEIEQIRFTFQQIAITWNDGGKTAIDDWNSQT